MMVLVLCHSSDGERDHSMREKNSSVESIVSPLKAEALHPEQCAECDHKSIIVFTLL